MQAVAKLEETKSAIAYQYEDLYERASKDSLSGLLNRATCELFIKERISSMTEGEICALFIVDLDDFKNINDTLGHIAGDEAIKESAEILSSLFRAKDIVGRLGGDEFIAFISGDIKTEDIEEIGSQICSKLQFSLGSGKNTTTLTASVGIYIADGKAEFGGMYQSADLALYKAKKSGKHCFYIKLNDSYQKGFSPVNAIPVGHLLEAIDSGIALLEVKNEIKIVFASRGFSKLLALDSLDLPIVLSNFIHPEDYRALDDEIKALSENGGEIERTLRANTKIGLRWWRVKISNYHYDKNTPFAIISANDVSEFKENEGRLEYINERLRAAIDQTAVDVWEVDVKKRLFVLHDEKKHTIRSFSFPEGLIKNGFIHQNSLLRFREFASEILRGQSQGYGNFIIKNFSNSAYSWTAISYRMIYDKDGSASMAVGIIETLSNTFRQESANSVPESLLPEALLSDLIERVRLNLTKDGTEEVWLGGHNLSDKEHSHKASEILERQKENIFREDGTRGLLSYFEIPKLLELYQEGKYWRSFVYQRADSGGNIRTVRHVFHILKSKESDDIFLNAYITRINIEKEFESLSLKPLECDSDTGFYKEEIFANLATSLFDSPHKGKSSIAAFHIEGMSYMSDIERSKTMISITSALSLALGGSSILGLYGEDKIIIILPGEHRRADLKKKFEDVFSFIRRTVEDADNLRFVVAIAIESAEKSTYDILLSSVLYLLSLWWNASSDMITFSQDGEDGGFVEIEGANADDKIVLLSSVGETMLTDGEKDVAIDSMRAMLSATSLENSVDSVLKIIGLYYDAERTYILNLAGGDRILTMPYEWNAANRRPISQVVSGMTVERFPIIKRCIKEKTPIVLNRHKADVAEIDEKSWAFIVFPIHQEPNDGFLCIENPKKNIENVSIISTLIPYITKEAARFDKTGDNAAAEELMGVPDLRSFMDFIPNLTSDNYSSLGVVCLDIPGMAAINSSFGFEYGSKLLWYISKILLDVFRANLVFRTWDAEFVAFLPNTTEQVFSSKCNRLRLLIQRKYHRDVRIGKAWADGVFKGRKLVEDARVNMRSDQSYTSTPTVPFILNKENERKEILRDAGAEEFIVYYQPKIDMKSKKAIGSEALVRGVEKDGTIIYPGDFISKLEQKGGIRELDLLVLEKTLNDLYQWKREGFEILPVSVNLSRVTLLYPSTLASLLAIESRYPDDITKLIEFEITENSGVLENEEFKKLVEHFREENFKISLDDFGSHYANLSILANVVFDTIKLDRSLVANIADNQINMMLVHDIVQICKKRGMNCIAEGVETEEQQNSLLSSGCRYAQGYLYDKPMAKEDFEEKYLRRIK